MPCNSLTNFGHEAFAKTRTYQFYCNLAKRYPYLEKEQLIQLGDVTRIKLALRNQGQLAPFVCYFVTKIGNFAIKSFEQKNFLSNCSKQLVTPVNLTRKKNDRLFNFQDWEQTPIANNCLL